MIWMRMIEWVVIFQKYFMKPVWLMEKVKKKQEMKENYLKSTKKNE